METIAHRDLRNSSSEILRRVAAGESFAVTNHGEVAAVLVPPSTGEMERLRHAGQVRPARTRRNFAQLTRARGVRSRDMLADLRGER